ncbi:hypothetical protein GGR58DRAFT_509015 [Xylaria digitata]|nr:hypothetical protein GGR58DRAFT_509015 [Xylaria digitata]
MALPLGAVQVAVISFIAYTLSAVALGLRFWSRALQNLSLRLPDYMIILALVNASGAVAVFLAAGFAAGLGMHQDELLATSPEIFRLHLKLFVPAQLLWGAANTCNKISILFLYTDLFPDKFFTRVCHSVIGISIAYFISVFLEAFLLCTPAAYNWDKSIVGGVCHNQNVAYLLAGITNLIIDTIVVALPMPKLFRLQMNLAKKISIAGMFSLGAFICVVSLLRVLWLINWDLNDLTYTVTPGAIYSVLEPTLGIVNACLPTIKPAMKRMIRRLDKQSRVIPSESATSDWKKPYTTGSAAHTFQPLHDDVPLTLIRGACFQSSIPVPTTKSLSRQNCEWVSVT